MSLSDKVSPMTFPMTPYVETMQDLDQVIRDPHALPVLALMAAIKAAYLDHSCDWDGDKRIQTGICSVCDLPMSPEGVTYICHLDHDGEPNKWGDLYVIDLAYCTTRTEHHYDLLACYGVRLDDEGNWSAHCYYD